jgi:succinyl-CoA synthetase alpha subunit
MAILIDKHSQIVVQGITGKSGMFHALRCLEYGSKIVAGISPGKGEGHIEGIPLFNTMIEAVQATGANVSMIMVPAPGAADCIMEAADAGIDLAVCITEGIPVRDMVIVKRFLMNNKMRLIGPNCPGVITPGQCQVGIMPSAIFQRGHVGVISRSGTLTYESVKQLGEAGFGQSTCVGIGGDPIIGLGFIDILKMFEEDPDTRGVFMIGEIGGTQEEEAARWIKQHMKKPVAAFVAGVAAPSGKRMGHAGAIISEGIGSASEKIKTLSKCGVTVTSNPAKISDAMTTAIKKNKKNLKLKS